MQKKSPLRTCIGCGKTLEKKELIRVVGTDDEVYELDFSGKKNGRGAYICKNLECLKLAKKKRGLERSFKGKVQPEVYDKLIEEFTNAGK